MNKVKTVRDEQLADEVKKLLEQSDVDDTVITEVVAKINEGDDVVDADGQTVEGIDLDAEETEPEKAQDEDDIVEEEDEEIDTEPEQEDEDNDVDLDADEEGEETTEDEDIDETEEVEVEEPTEDADEDVEENAEFEGEEQDDVVPEEEVEDDDVEAEQQGMDDPFAKLKDPAFADAFNRGYAFAIGLMKMGKLPEMASDEMEEEQEEKVEPATPEMEEQDEEKKVAVAADSIDVIKAQLTKEISAQFSAKLQAKDKVRALVGEIRDVMAFDSASDIYKFALEKNGVNIGKYAPSAYEGMIDMMIEKRNNIDIPVVVKDSNPFEGCSKDLNQAIARLKKINS